MLAVAFLQQLDLIRRGTAAIIPEEELERKVAAAIDRGGPLTVIFMDSSAGDYREQL